MLQFLYQCGLDITALYISKHVQMKEIPCNIRIAVESLSHKLRGQNFMNVEFINGAGMRCEFTDDGIICRIGSNNTLFPYGSIETIRWYWGSIDIAGGGKTFTFVPY